MYVPSTWKAHGILAAKEISIQFLIWFSVIESASLAIFQGRTLIITQPCCGWVMAEAWAVGQSWALALSEGDQLRSAMHKYCIFTVHLCL